MDLLKFIFNKKLLELHQVLHELNSYVCVCKLYIISVINIKVLNIEKSDLTTLEHSHQFVYIFLSILV